MSFNSIYRIAGSAMNAQTVRLNTVASNLANIDTAATRPDDVYQARRPVFAAIYEKDRLTQGGDFAGAKVQILDVVSGSREPIRRYEPDSELADENGYVFYSNINQIEEMTDMMSASRSFETNVEVLNRLKSMQQSLLRLGEA